MSLKSVGWIFIIFLALALLATPILTCAAQDQEEKTNDSTFVVIPLDTSMVAAAKEFAQQLQASNIIRVAAMVYAPPGMTPYMVIAGNQPDLQQAVDLQRRLLPDKSCRPIVVIGASLRELTKSTTLDIGVNPVPSVSGSISYQRELNGTSTGYTNQQVEGTFSNMVTLNDALNKSKVLVSSEVYTPNGIKAQISNVKSVPIFSTDVQGNVQTQFQNLETSISVVPTIVEYKADKPEDSLIRVDVEVKVSIISGTTVFKGVSAPEYSVKTMSTTRIIAANNRCNVIGTFVTDGDTKSIIGIPVLGRLPLLKYLFSQETIQKQRNTAVLTLSVRLLPLADEQASSH